MTAMRVTTNATFPKSLCASEHAKLIGSTNGLFPDFGHHSEREMGGLWMHPIKLLDGFWLRFHDLDADNVDTWIVADRYEIQPWGDRFDYLGGLGHTNLTIHRDQIAPDSARGVIISYTFVNHSDRPRRIQAELFIRTELYPAWFSLDSRACKDGKDEGEWDEETLTYRARDTLNPWYMALRCGTRPRKVKQSRFSGYPVSAGQGTAASFLYDMTLPGNGEKTLQFYVTGAVGDPAKVEKDMAELTSGRDFHLEKQQRYDAMLAASRLKVGDSRFEEIWDWVKVHCDWLTVDAGEYGRALAAGLPEYPWWFGCDNCYSIQGLLCIGQYELARQTLKLLADYSWKVNGNGRIVHEITPFGLCPNPGNTQETAHFVTAVWHYWKWTGDFSLVEELLPMLRLSMLWLRQMDDDGDMFPSGYGIIEIAGLNAEMVDTIVYYAQAWNCFADMCAHAGDTEEAASAREMYRRVCEAIDTVMWDEEEGLYCDACASPDFVRECRETILNRRREPRSTQADDRFDRMVSRKAARGMKETGFLINHNWIINTPMESGIAPADKAAIALANMDNAEFIGPWGMYLNVLGKDQTMTISTGAMAVAQARYGYADRALALLDKMCATFGMIGPGQFAEMSPDYGCFVQAWTAYAMFTPVVRHFFGIQPDAAAGVVTVHPQLPSRWPEASVENVRALDGSISVSCRRTEGGYRLQLSGTGSLTVRIPLEKGQYAQTVHCDLRKEDDAVLLTLPEEGGVAVDIASSEY